MNATQIPRQTIPQSHGLEALDGASVATGPFRAGPDRFRDRLRRLPASSCHGARLVDASSLLPLSPRRPRRERDPRPPSAGEARRMNEVIDGSLSR